MANLINEHVNFSYTNGTLLDPFLENINLVTLNKNYLPLSTQNAKDLRARTTATVIKETPGYLTAKIEVYYAGVLTYSIPLLFPDSASESLGANFIKENPVGSSKPIVAFSNTTTPQVNLSFIALSDYLPTGYNSFQDYLETIKQMVKPKTSGSYVKSPEVYVEVANLKFYGVCDSISIDYDQTYGDNTYIKANISCQFTKTS